MKVRSPDSPRSRATAISSLETNACVPVEHGSRSERQSNYSITGMSSSCLRSRIKRSNGHFRITQQSLPSVFTRRQALRLPRCTRHRNRLSPPSSVVSLPNRLVAVRSFGSCFDIRQSRERLIHLIYTLTIHYRPCERSRRPKAIALGLLQLRASGPA